MKFFISPLLFIFLFFGGIGHIEQNVPWRLKNFRKQRGKSETEELHHRLRGWTPLFRMMRFSL